MLWRPVFVQTKAACELPVRTAVLPQPFYATRVLHSNRSRFHPQILRYCNITDTKTVKIFRLYLKKSIYLQSLLIITVYKNELLIIADINLNIYFFLMPCVGYRIRKEKGVIILPNNFSICVNSSFYLSL